MSETDFDCFTRRADEEMAAASKASSGVAERVHREMADRFRARATKINTDDQPLGTSGAA